MKKHLRQKGKRISKNQENLHKYMKNIQKPKRKGQIVFNESISNVSFSIDNKNDNEEKETNQKCNNLKNEKLDNLKVNEQLFFSEKDNNAMKILKREKNTNKSLKLNSNVCTAQTMENLSKKKIKQYKSRFYDSESSISSIESSLKSPENIVNRVKVNSPNYSSESSDNSKEETVNEMTLRSNGDYKIMSSLKKKYEQELQPYMLSTDVHQNKNCEIINLEDSILKNKDNEKLYESEHESDETFINNNDILQTDHYHKLNLMIQADKPVLVTKACIRQILSLFEEDIEKINKVKKHNKLIKLNFFCCYGELFLRKTANKETYINMKHICENLCQELSDKSNKNYSLEYYNKFFNEEWDKKIKKYICIREQFLKTFNERMKLICLI